MSKDSPKKPKQSVKDLGKKIEDKVKKSLDKLEVILKEDLLGGESPIDRGLDRLEVLLNQPLFRDKGKKGKDGRGAFDYLEVFLRDQVVATVSPSSKYVIKKVLKALDLGHARVVVEYGPADGVITRHVLEHLPKDAVLVAIERNGDFFEMLKKNIQDPRLKAVQGDVRDVDAILDKLGIGKVDRTFSGIPFSFLSAAEREELLRATGARLAPEGRFVAYQVTTHLIPLLKRHFRDVDVRFEIRNVPPHFVFTAFK